jgi:hypothetical protein
VAPTINDPNASVVLDITPPPVGNSKCTVWKYHYGDKPPTREKKRRIVPKTGTKQGAVTGLLFAKRPQVAVHSIARHYSEGRTYPAKGFLVDFSKSVIVLQYPADFNSLFRRFVESQIAFSEPRELMVMVRHLWFSSFRDAVVNGIEESRPERFSTRQFLQSYFVLSRTISTKFSVIFKPDIHGPIAGESNLGDDPSGISIFEQPKNFCESWFASRIAHQISIVNPA